MASLPRAAGFTLTESPDLDRLRGRV